MMSRQTMIRGRMAADRLTYSTLLTIDSVESSDVWQPECALPRKHPGTPERACVHYINIILSATFEEWSAGNHV